MKKRLIIKIGSDTLTSKKGLNYERIISLANEISHLHYLGYEILIVSSGAVASGIKRLDINSRSNDLVDKRVYAAIGQSYLMEAWIKAFHSIAVAQMLVTWQDLASEESKLKIRETIYKLLDKRVITIINENDAIADEELNCGDNDQLSLKIAKLVLANRLVMMTDVEGLYTKNPKEHANAKLIKRVSKVDEATLSMAEYTVSQYGRGGMLSKVTVAKEGLDSGITVNIINGTRKGAILSLIKDGASIGTEFSNNIE